MEYPESFEKLIEESENGTFIGLGNPNAPILVVGKEVSTNLDSSDPLEKQNWVSYSKNRADWKSNIRNKKSQDEIKEWIFDLELPPEKVDNNPLFAFKGTQRKNTTDTWKNYQKLHDYIFNPRTTTDKNMKLDFQENFFITEMSNIPSPKTKDAQKNDQFRKKLEERKKSLFQSSFIKNFPVVVLACSDYIWNKANDWQINRIFEVKFDNKRKFSKGEYSY